MQSLASLASSTGAGAGRLWLSIEEMLSSGLVLQVSPLVAVLGSFSLSLIFVLSLYVWKFVGYEDKNRDAPGTIQRRFLSAILSCFCSALLVRLLARPAVDGEIGLSLPELLGLRCDGQLYACLSCLLLTAVLFVGPLVQHFTAVWDGEAEILSFPGGHWIMARNLILAPVTEEFVFRGCLVRLWVTASFPAPVIIFCSPFCFALAHTHHFIEIMRRTGHKKTALMQVAFQVFYTSLFGMYSTFLLMRTGSMLAVILAHTFCNHQGFPALGFFVSEHDSLYRHRLWLGALYLTGIVAFGVLMAPLTSGFTSTFWPAVNTPSTL